MRRKILLMTFLVAIIGFCGTSLSAQVAKVGDNGYASVITAIQAAIEQKVSEVTLLENSSEVMPTDVEFILKADLKITANSPVTAEFYNNGTSYDFIFNSYENGGHTLTIGENVTFNLKDRIIWAGYYGDNITVVVEGTLIGGNQYWCGAKTKVTKTGTLKSAGEALVLRRGTTLQVDGGKIEANYFSFLSGKVIAKNNATITSGPIWVANEGNYIDEGNVELTLDNSTWTSSGNIKLKSTHDNGVVLNVKNGAKLSASSKEYGANVIGSSAVVNVDNAVLNLGTQVTNDGEINATNGAIISTPKDVTIGGNVNVDEYSSILPQGTVAKIGDTYYKTLQEALNAAAQTEELTTIQLLAGTHTFGNVKFPATLKNVTIVGADNKATIIKDSKLHSADGNAVTYKGITFDGIIFDNSSILFTGARNGEVVYEDWTIKNCDFINLQSSDGIAAIHFNLASDETIKNFTFENNTIKNVSSPSNTASALRLNYVTGNVVIKDNETNNVAFNAVQIINSEVDNFTFEGNILRSNNSSLANLYNVTGDNIVITKNQFLANEDQKGVSGIASADVSGNYWGGGAPTNLPEGVVYSSYYTTVESDGTLGGLVELPVGGTWGGIDWSFEVTDVNTGLGTLTIAPTTGTPVPDPNASSRTYEVGQWREAVIYDKSSGEGKDIGGWPYDRSKVQTLIIKEGVTSIGSFAAQGFTNLTGEVVIPYTVKYIGQEAFQNSRMTTLTFGAVPEEKTGEGEELCIAQGAFKNLIIEEVSLPADRPVHLHAWVFNKCLNLKNAVMPATIVSVHGTNHIDYFKDFNAHSNPTWTKSSEIFAYNENMETVTFGSQEVMDLFYANNNGTANDYLKANVGLVTYCDVQDAIEAAVASGESISLVKNCNADDDNKLEIPSGVTITVDLKGKTMTGSILAPNANLTVKNGTIDNKDASVSAIEINAGELTLNNVNISSARHAVRIDGDVTATIDGGEYKSATGTGTGTYHAVNVSGAANVTINAGTFVGPKGTIADSGSAINVQTGATVTIKGGDFSKGKNSTLSADGTLIVEGGTYDQDVTKFCSAIYRCVYNSEIEKYEIIRVLPGQGTEEDPYLINDISDLEFFRDAVNAGETKFNAPGVWVALGDDIDMEGTVWTDGIGDGINATFDGCFDGRTHTIKNFTMEAYADSDGYVCGGLFGYIYGKNGVVIIRNLVMENVNVTCDAERTGDKNKEPHNIGALVGFAMRCENSIIDNITVKGDIVIDAQNVDGVGAIVGYSHTAAPNITNCKVVANDGSYIKGHSFVGGITGYSYTNATITDCTVENIDIIGTSYSVGGITGIVLANNTIKNCTVTENVEVNGQANVGYLVGAISSNGIVVNIENCSAREPMIGGNYSDNIVIVARIENKYYSTLAAAFTAAQNDETVTLVANTELSEMIAIPNGKIVTLDLNGKTITGTDNTEKNFSIIDNRGDLTITDSSKPSTGKMTLTATVNSGWNRYSAVIANNPGGKLTIEAGTIEHLGGTDMAYGIDNLTNGKGTYAETVINGGTIKSTYRAIRQFLNGTESQNILTVNGGTIEGANKSIWMQDPNKSANTGTLTVSENAELIGDVYLFVTEGSTEWPVEVSIVAAVLQGKSTVLTGNVPAGYDVQLENGVYGVKRGVAKIDNVLYSSLADAVAAAQNNGTIQLLWQEGQPPIAMNANLFGKNVTITGTATVDWSKGNLFVGRGGEGNATLTFDGANLTSASNSASYGIHVSGREKNTNDKYDGTLIIKNSKIELDYLINKGAITLDNSTLTVKNGFSIGGRPASETESGVDATATITLSNGSKVVVNNHNGMGLGYEAIGVMNIDATSTFETTQPFKITAKGTLNNAGTVNITGALTNNGTINFTAETATLATTTNNLTVVLAFENSSAYKVVYENNTYSVVLIPVQEQHLVAGWNWYSTYLDITLNDLTTALGDNGVYIKNNDGIFKENNGGSWTGQLNTINPSEMYLVQTTAECDLKLAADLLNPNEHQISLIAEWNWIGYPSSQEGVNINDALKNLNANSGDIIKSLNNGYAEYEFGQWLGTLNTMVPGVGYKYNNKSGEVKTFYYNFEATRGAVEANVTAENNYWTPNATKYPFNMTMTAVVDGLTNGNYEVAAFVNGEVRGSARPIYVEAIDAHIFFLTIHGEDVEEMSFRLYDIDTDTEYDLNDRINYSNDAMLGSVNEPYVFTRGTTGIGEAAMSQVNIYPNPTTIGTEINLEATCDKVEVFNTLGVKVAEYQNVDSIDALETAGIYVIRITNNGNTQNCRLVVK